MEDPDMGDFRGDFFSGGMGFNDFSDDGPHMGMGPPPQMFRGGRGSPWRGGRGGRGHFDGGNGGFGPRGPPPRFRGGRGGFMGGPGPRHEMNMRGPGPRGFRGGHFERPFRPGGPGPDRGGWDGPSPYMSPNGGGVHGPPDRDRPDMGGGGGGPIGCEPEQIWAETKTEGGSSYFYNTKTRVTSWDRPEGPNIKIMSHEEFTMMMKGAAESGDSPGLGSPAGNQVLDRVRNSGNNFASPFKQSEVGDGMIEKLDPAPNVPPMNMGMNVPRPALAHQQQQQLPPGFPSFSGPPPGFNLQFPHNFPMVPPPWNPMTSVAPPAGVPAPVPDPILQHIDPQIVAKAFEWTEHVAPDGKLYYYNLKSQSSVWEKPPFIVEFETAKVIAQQRLVQQAMMAASKEKNDKADKSSEKAREIETKRVGGSSGDKCKPVSSTPVTGTPWCIVWTGDKRVFFYNPSTKSSVWEKPPELLGRLDVEELLRGPSGKSIPIGPVKKAEATSTSVTSESAANHSNSPSAPPLDKQHDTKIIIQLDKRHRDKEEPPAVGEPLDKKLKTDQDQEGQEVITIEDDEKKNPLKEANALEAEVKAARERAIVPLETRLQQFKEMLEEKQVSAFSTWEKELHKIVFDSRYLLLTSKERKAAFDDYVKERALEERREKKARSAQLKESFMKFLEQIHVHQKMSYNEFAQKFSRDERFRTVEKSRDRESYFSEFIAELKKKERDARKMERDKIKETFTDALQERIKNYRVHWVDVKKKFEEARFSILDSEEKEELFRVFQKRLKSELKSKERKKKKKSKGEKQKKKEKEKGARSKVKSTDDNESHETVENVDRSEEVEEGETPDSDKSEAGDESDKMEDISEEEEDGAVSEETDEEGRVRKEKAEHSIREREKEVQRALATHLRDRDKERDFYRREEAVLELQSILTDVVRAADTSWKDAKKSIKKDRRWSAVSVLTREEMEELFNHHCDTIVKKKKLRFRDLMQEARVKLNSTWKEVRRKIRDDPRFQKFSGDERRCEREFQLYLKDLLSTIKSEFRGLLKETKMLSYKTKHQIRENPQVLKDIEAVLEKDKRFLNLESMPDDRHRLLGEYLEELERKGPPPPPTATDKVTRRLK